MNSNDLISTFLKLD